VQWIVDRATAEDEPVRRGHRRPPSARAVMAVRPQLPVAPEIIITLSL
jgi:hypothetical protein